MPRKRSMSLRDEASSDAPKVVIVEPAAAFTVVAAAFRFRCVPFPPPELTVLPAVIVPAPK